MSSSKPDMAVQELCTHWFGDYVEYAIGDRADLKRKPAPDTVNAAFDALKIDAEGAVYIGDSEVDAATATNCGLPFIGVSWGFRGKEVLAELGVTDIVDYPQELLKYFI